MIYLQIYFIGCIINILILLFHKDFVTKTIKEIVSKEPLYDMYPFDYQQQMILFIFVALSWITVFKFIKGVVIKRK